METVDVGRPLYSLYSTTTTRELSRGRKRLVDRDRTCRSLRLVILHNQPMMTATDVRCSCIRWVVDPGARVLVTSSSVQERIDVLSLGLQKTCAKMQPTHIPGTSSRHLSRAQYNPSLGSPPRGTGRAPVHIAVQPPPQPPVHPSATGVQRTRSVRRGACRSWSWTSF